jgi:hypothetical protein
MSASADVTVAKALGWASFAIGLTEILAARPVERLLGIGDHKGLLTSFGVRECAAGAALVTAGAEPNAQLATGMWARVAGDAVDLAMLGAAARKTSNPRGLAFATAMVLGITALDVLYAIRVQDRQSHPVRTRARDARTEFVGRAQSFGGRIGEMLAGL